MLDTYDRIMKKDASCYISEMCNAYEKSNNGITSYPLVEYLLSSVLLRLTGFMEQKLDTLQLILCDYNADLRYRLLRDHNKLSSSYDAVVEIYSKFRCSINEIDTKNFYLIKNHYEKTIFSNKEQMQRAYVKILNTFTNHPITNHIKRKFDEYKKFEDYFIDSNAEYASTLQKLHDPSTPKEQKEELHAYLKKLQKKSKANKKKSKAKNNINFVEIYKKTILFRHLIAHNLTSVQADFPTITSMKSPDFQYENYFVRYMILLCVDEIFRDMYQYYKSITSQYLL
jgi:hypothetical protein